MKTERFLPKSAFVGADKNPINGKGMARGEPGRAQKAPLTGLLVGESPTEGDVVLYVDGKPYTHYRSADDAAEDINLIKKKYPNKKIELKTYNKDQKIKESRAVILQHHALHVANQLLENFGKGNISESKELVQRLEVALEAANAAQQAAIAINMKKRHQKPKSECAGVGAIAKPGQEKDPRYSMSLTKDVRPNTLGKEISAYFPTKSPVKSKKVDEISNQLAVKVGRKREANAVASVGDLKTKGTKRAQNQAQQDMDKFKKNCDILTKWKDREKTVPVSESVEAEMARLIKLLESK